MTANPSPGDALSRHARARSVVVAVAAVVAITVLVLAAVVMLGFASVIGCLVSAFTMYGIFKLCASADTRR